MALANHTTRWTTQELTDLVDLWDGTAETLEVIADLLGRTVEACRQRYYMWTWDAATTVVAKPVVKGEGQGTTRRQPKAVPVGLICQSCYLELPVAATTCPDC